MTQVMEQIPSDCRIGCPVVVSQDGHNEQVEQVIQSFQKRFDQIQIPMVHLQHDNNDKNPYRALAVHYGWAIGRVFSNEAAKRVLILEEDLSIAPDFFDYFWAMAPVLDEDPTLLAVSAFNDNGKEGMVQDATRVLRSDFFPGLGWMMTRKLWDTELAAKWPDGYWDDWLREPNQRKERHVLRPEISRTFHFGTKGGASNNQFGQHLTSIHLNHDKINWSQQQPQQSLLLQRNSYDRAYLDLILLAATQPNVPTALRSVRNENVRLEYKDMKQFRMLARQLRLMDDEKAGVPRTAYRGVVECRPHGHYLLFLTPPQVAYNFERNT